MSARSRKILELAKETILENTPCCSKGLFAAGTKIETSFGDSGKFRIV